MYTDKPGFFPESYPCTSVPHPWQIDFCGEEGTANAQTARKNEAIRNARTASMQCLTFFSSRGVFRLSPAVLEMMELYRTTMRGR